MLHEITVYTVGYERAGRVENRFRWKLKVRLSWDVYHRFMQYQFRDVDSDCFIREDLSASVFH